MSIYTARFFVGTKAVGTSTLYTVPSGKRAILRDVDVLQVAGAAGDSFSLGHGVGGTDTLWFKVLPGIGLWGSWRGRATYLAGETIRANSSAGNWRVQATGYLFDDP